MCGADARAVGSAHFGNGSLPIKMDEVGCSGSEMFLVNCSFVSRHDCSNIEEAGVICSETGLLFIFFLININKY